MPAVLPFKEGPNVRSRPRPGAPHLAEARSAGPHALTSHPYHPTPMKKLMCPIGLAIAAIFASPSSGPAQIKAYTLDEMVAESDGAIFGQIIGQRVFRVDHDVDGPELYFTTLTIEGTTLGDRAASTVDVTFAGGFINEEEGVFNSEAPIADDIKIGNRIVAFYAWQDDMGGEVAGNSLMAAHGGLYRTVTGPTRSVVLGRGDGYAVPFNIKVDDLDSAVRTIRDKR